MTEEVLKQFEIDILEKRIARDPLVKAMQLVLTETTKIEKSNNARPATDADLFKTLRVTIKGLQETEEYMIDGMADDEIGFSDKRQYIRDQLELFKGYLPRMLTEKDLVVAISGIMAINGITCSQAGMKDMGIVMRKLKEAHPGQYDGKLASQIFKNIIS